MIATAFEINKDVMASYTLSSFIAARINPVNKEFFL